MNRITIPLSIILAATLSACATDTKTSGMGSLRSVFEHYKRVAAESDQAQSKFFTAKMWKSFQKSRRLSESKSNDSVNIGTHFPNDLIITGSMESMEITTGCLIVQGNDSRGTPMDYNITFEKQNNRWVFSDIVITLYDSGQQRWLSDPVCDPQRKHQLWMKHLQAESEELQQ
jgi:hypothetical protein